MRIRKDALVQLDSGGSIQLPEDCVSDLQLQKDEQIKICWRPGELFVMMKLQGVACSICGYTVRNPEDPTMTEVGNGHVCKQCAELVKSKF